MKKRILLSGVVALLLAVTGCTYNTTNKTDKKDSTEKQVEDTVIAQNRDTTTTKPASANKEESEAWRLVPGHSAGLTRINENAEEVYKKLGNPDGGDDAMQKAVAIWYSNHDSTNHSVAIYTSREPGVDPIARIRQIRVTSPSFKTVEGVGPGSTITDVRNIFRVSQAEQYNDAGINYKVYDSPQGIAFETNPGGRCVAIVIHEAGATDEGTYLKFRTTNKFISRKKI